MKPIKLKLFGLNVLEFGSLADGAVPQKQTKFLSPRYEPSNITTDADVLRITEAIRVAESGDTQELFRFYRDVLLSDDHIAGEFSTRKLAVLAQPLAILPEDKNNPDDVLLAKAMFRAKNDCENWMDGMKALMGSHAIWPVTICERLYQPAGPARPGEPPLNFTLRKFVPVNPQLICFQWAYMMGGVGLGAASAIQLGNLAGNRGRRPADSYTIDLEKWEHYGAPWPIGYADAKDPEAIRLLQEAFTLSKTIGGLVVDENSRVELKEAMFAGMAGGYETFHNICNSAISFRITGLKETKKPAGLNAGENPFQQNIREDVRVHDQMMLAETCKKQIAWPFRDLNHLRGDVKFVWGGLSDADAKTFADLLYTMRQAGYQLAGESLPIANERTGLCWERAAIPAPAGGPHGGILPANGGAREPALTE